MLARTELILVPCYLLPFFRGMLLQLQEENRRLQATIGQMKQRARDEETRLVKFFWCFFWGEGGMFALFLFDIGLLFLIIILREGDGQSIFVAVLRSC